MKLSNALHAPLAIAAFALFAAPIDATGAPRAGKRIDRSDWVEVGVPIVGPMPYNRCHGGSHHQPVAPRVNEPARFWLKVPPGDAAHAAATACVQRHHDPRDVVEVDRSKAIAACLRSKGIEIEEGTMYVQPARSDC